MDYAETQIKSVIQSTIDKLLTTHKKYKDDDAKYCQSAYEVLHTFMNNIHLTQSLIYSAVISKPFKINQPVSGTDNPATNTDDLAQTVIKEEEIFVPRIIKSGSIPAVKTEDINYSVVEIDEDSNIINSPNSAQTPAQLKQNTLDKWISNTSETNKSHYVRRSTPPLRRRYVEEPYADFYDYDNLPQEYYEPNEEDETESRTGWTYTEEDYEHGQTPGEEKTIDKYLANTEFARATTPPMPEDYRYGITNFNMDVQQCCARIGKTRYDVEEKDPEFMDSYPADTYRDMQGYVYGLPCANMIPNDDFELGIIFCSSHNSGYEDIRSAPKIKENA